MTSNKIQVTSAELATVTASCYCLTPAWNRVVHREESHGGAPQRLREPRYLLGAIVASRTLLRITVRGRRRGRRGGRRKTARHIARAAVGVASGGHLGGGASAALGVAAARVAAAREVGLLEFSKAEIAFSVYRARVATAAARCIASCARRWARSSPASSSRSFGRRRPGSARSARVRDVGAARHRPHLLCRGGADARAPPVGGASVRRVAWRADSQFCAAAAAPSSAPASRAR